MGSRSSLVSGSDTRPFAEALLHKCMDHLPHADLVLSDVGRWAAPLSQMRWWRPTDPSLPVCFQTTTCPQKPCGLRTIMRLGIGSALCQRVQNASMWGP